MIPGLEILNLHAQGGMAEVYRAKGKGADGRVWHYAVKRILPELTQDATLRSMFVEEARIASMLVHPNIVRVYDLARGANDDYYIVMEFLEGRDLAETIDKAHDLGRSLPVWFCIHAAREVLHALMYATTEAQDRQGRALALIHRDISPHNIFICFDGQVKLTDFGVAKVAQSNVLTQVGVTKGKFGYMSPEQLLSEKLDFRSDLFNVGILLYETLTGRRLFFGDNASQFLQAMLRAEVPPLDAKLGVPSELEALIRRTLSKDRNARPATAAQLDDELRVIAERYNLVATREHLSGEVRALFGSEIESCPVPQARPATAPRMLASVQAAQPDVVRRVPSRIVPVSPVASVPVSSVPVSSVPVSSVPAVPPTPMDAAGRQLFPPQPNRTRSLSDPSVDVRIAPKELSRPSVDVRPAARSAPKIDARNQPVAPRESPADGSTTIADEGRPRSNERAPRAVTRPQGPSLATATSSGSGAVSSSKAPRPGTRSVRALPDAADVRRLELDDDTADPATIPPDDLRADRVDPSTIPPDAQQTPLDGTDYSSLRGARKPTVIVVGGAGAKPIGDGRKRDGERSSRDGERSSRDSERGSRDGERGSRDGERAKPFDEKPTSADDDWSDATVNADALGAKPSGVVTRSPKVVPLPSKKK